MKKKFLSLMMAAAMVATTSVSAFADKTHQILDSTEKESEITVTGNIANDKDQIAPSTISVTVPTTATFTVFKNKKVEAPTITIKSDSEEKVQVTAYKFSDPTSEQITVVSETELADGDTNADTPTHKHVSLKLTGKEKSVVLKSSGADSGIFQENGTAEATGKDTLLGTVSKDNPLDLNLVGHVRNDYTAPTEAISNTFTLVLKLRRVDKN